MRSRRSETAPPRALVFVRNGVTHDARVQRGARALRDAGLDPLVVGVLTTDERRTRSIEGGVPVVRLDPTGRPAALLRRLLRRGPHAAGGASRPSGAARDAGPGPAGGRGARVRRAFITAELVRQSIALLLRERPRLVHCNDLNTMWIGVAARLLTRARVVYDAHELWPDRNGRPEWRLGVIAEEAVFVRVADRVITTSPGYADALARRYRIPAPPVIRNIPERLAVAPAGPPAQPPLAVYVGGLLRGRGLEQAIDALALVPDVRMRFLGPGRPAYRRELRERAQAAGVAGRLELCEPVAAGDVVAALRGATVGLALIQPICRSYELTLPNKLFEYAGAGLPMVVSDLPVMAALVREWDCGEVAPPVDVPAIAAAIQALIDPSRRALRAAGARRLAETVTWERERARLVALYRELAG